MIRARLGAAVLAVVAGCGGGTVTKSDAEPLARRVSSESSVPTPLFGTPSGRPGSMRVFSIDGAEGQSRNVFGLALAPVLFVWSPDQTAEIVLPAALNDLVWCGAGRSANSRVRWGVLCDPAQGSARLVLSEDAGETWVLLTLPKLENGFDQIQFQDDGSGRIEREVAERREAIDGVEGWLRRVSGAPTERTIPGQRLRWTTEDTARTWRGPIRSEIVESP